MGYHARGGKPPGGERKGKERHREGGGARYSGFRVRGVKHPCGERNGKERQKRLRGYTVQRVQRPMRESLRRGKGEVGEGGGGE